MQDIFEQLKEIEKGNIDFYSSIPAEERNDVNPFMLMKWMSCTTNAKQLLHINNLVNTKVFALSKHKELLVDLLIASSNGKQYYKWLKRSSKKVSPVVNMISDAHNCGTREAVEILELYSKQELLDLCDDMHYDKATIDKIKKEINVLRV